MFRRALAVLAFSALCVALFACGAATAPGGSAGYDCFALRTKQVAAHCPRFDENEFLALCDKANAALPTACLAQAAALSNCYLAQPAACTASGTVDDIRGCESLEDARGACTLAGTK
jgi:hypothetical protein